MPIPHTTRLRRTTRFALRPGTARGVNGYAGSPPLPADTLTPYLACTVECLGEPDPTSGYLINIKTIDDAVHTAVRPRFEQAIASEASSSATDPTHLGTLLTESLAALAETLPVPVAGLTLHLSPYHALAMTTDAPQLVTILLRFDFAAAHRLHVPAWDEATNREYFGKCNNPNGHGHNYQLEVRVTLPATALSSVPTHAIEQVVEDTVIASFDHTHLNLDTEEFADSTGVIPTVENIARVCYELLQSPIAALGERLVEGHTDAPDHAVTLRTVRVWETDRTSSEYPA